VSSTSSGSWVRVVLAVVLVALVAVGLPVLGLGGTVAASATPGVTGVAGGAGEGAGEPVRLIVEMDLGSAIPGGGIGAMSMGARRAAVGSRAAEVTAELEHLGAEVSTTFVAQPYLAVSVDARDLPALAALPGVASIAPDEQVRVQLDESLPTVGATDPVPSYVGSGLDGSGWAVAVIDTGVDREHGFFSAAGGGSRVVAEACFSQDRDCPNGETSMTGVDGAAAPLQGSPHGTHVAGIAAGGGGTAPAQGVAPLADIVAVQAFSVGSEDLGAYVTDLASGLQFVYDQHVADNGIDVAAVNLSLGLPATGTCPSGNGWDLFSGLVDDLRTKGVLTVAASGNDGSSDSMSAPGCLGNVISVGATDDQTAIASFSNLSGGTDLVAPGWQITSSVPGGYVSSSGTSMAAPHVSGALALLREAAPETPITEVLSALTTSETFVADHRSGGTVTGLPFLDLPKALTALPGALGGPSAPGTPSATAGDGVVDVSWAAPDGGSGIERYDVISRPGGHTCQTTGTTASPPTTACTVSGLDNGTAYTFTVIASNASGPGPSSFASDAVVPIGSPSAPTNLRATVADGQVSLSWDAPTDDGGSSVVKYAVTSGPSGFGCLTTDSTGTPPDTGCIIDGLTYTTEYTFTVTATNADDKSSVPSESVTVTISTVPGAPQDVAATAGNGRADVSWAKPAHQGSSPITSYRVTSTPEGKSCDLVELEGDLRCTVTGLTNGTEYTFTVVAENREGTGPASASTLPIVPATVPGAPTGVTVTAGGTQGTAVVSWTAPASDGGSAILEYTATADPGGQSCTADGLSLTCTVAGLTGDTAYTFRVVATNARGASAPSTASATFTPAAAPTGGGGGGGSGRGGGGTLPPPEEASETTEPEPVTSDGSLPSQQPGTSTLLLDGEPAATDVTSTDGSVTLSGDGFTLALSPRTSTGEAKPSVSGTTVGLHAGGAIGVAFDGLEAGSRVHNWLFSDPVLLGTSPVSSSGGVDDTVWIPTATVAGEHTVQVSGVLADGRSVALNLGVVVAAAVGFPDVAGGSTHGASILRLAELGVVSGFADGTYGPGEVITRGQMAAFLARALSLEPGDPNVFADVVGTTHAASIGAIASAGIAGGFGDGTYRPNAHVTRGQMATFLAHAVGLAEVADGPFGDLDGNTHAGTINAVASAGIASGYPDGTYRPGISITRAQMASLIGGMLDHLDAAP